MAQHPGREGPGRRRRACKRRGNPSAHGRLGDQSAHDLPRSGRRRASSIPASCARSSNIRMQGRCGQAASGARPAAAISRRRCRGLTRPAGHRALGRPCRARLQPGQIWRVLARAGHGDHAAQPRRPVARAGRRLRAVGGGAVCALRAEGRLGRRQAEVPEGHHGAAGAPCAGHRQDHPPRRTAHARRHRGALSACPAATGTMANCRPTRC